MLSMVEILPISVWFAIVQAVLVCASVVTLLFQRPYYKRAPPTTEAGCNVPPLLPVDQQRDPSVAFSDSQRPTRLCVETTLLTIISIFGVYYTARQHEGTTYDDNAIYEMCAPTITLMTWLYTCILSWISLRHRLPNGWGFVLNVHLCVLFCFTWCSIVYDIYESRILTALNTLQFLLTTDLVYITLTTAQGPRFLDPQGRPVIEYKVSSVIGTLFFSWLTPLIRFGYKKQRLDEDDIPSLPPGYRSSYLMDLFGRFRGARLLYRLYRANRSMLGIYFVLSIVMALLHFLPPFLVNQFLELIQEQSDNYLELAWIVILLQGGSLVTRGILEGQFWFLTGQVFQVPVLATLYLEVYRKALRARVIEQEQQSNKENESSSASIGGQGVNLMSTDAYRVSTIALWPMNLIVMAPVQLVVGIYFLYTLLGISSLFGLAVMLITLPVNHYSAKLLAKTQMALGEARDKRVSLMNEVLQGIRQIKFFASERSWEKRIMETRENELGLLRTSYLVLASLQLVWQGSPVLIALLSFWSFTVLEQKELTAAIAFTSIIVFNQLRFALNALPETFVELIKAYTSAKRLDRFFNVPEISQPESNVNDVHRIGFRDATVTWPANASNDDTGFFIKHVNLEFPHGELSLISGKTGAGKSLLLTSLLGETTIVQGYVDCPRAALICDHDTSSMMSASSFIDQDDAWIVDHAVAYVAQNAWLQNGSIRDNILFGLPYRENRYRATLTACALDKDLLIFEDGDLTEIGEKGITLSGGQKARVALARAVYSRAKNVLMDDILSAVDSHTAQHLYQYCLTGPLMNNRTRILVTHHIKLCLPGAAYLAHIEKGRIDAAGSPSELRLSGSLARIMQDEEEQISHQGESEIEKYDDIEETMPSKKKRAPAALIEKEERATGRIKMRYYGSYFASMGRWIYWPELILLVVGACIFEVGEFWSIKEWTQAVDPDVKYYLKMYTLVILASVGFGVVQYVAMYLGGLRASRDLYYRLLHRILRAPMRFFDTTPIGRILNRFSKDMETIDSTIPDNVMNVAANWTTVLVNVVVVTIMLPTITVPLLILIALIIALGFMFVVTARELKRIDSVTRSLIYDQFSETIAGVKTIRAFGASRRFMEHMMNKVDANARPFFFAWTSNHWVAQRFYIFNAIVNVGTGAFILINMDKLDASIAGFVLTLIVSLSDQMFTGMRHYATLEMNFNSVERIVEFTEIEQEATSTNGVQLPALWPSEGNIQVKDLEVRYAADLDPVLKRVTFAVRPSEKIGIVGRTGSGKSTLALSFFRFIETTHGSIAIDGIDIKSIDIEQLRSRLLIIPQDPTLFSGTLRSNMDPFDEYDDEEIFEALRRTHLLDDTNSMFQDLNMVVSEGGNNLSQGQRQLVCLARALLRRNKVVLMDEATASVDFQTDRAIQKTIASEFSGCTILCIAHRLHTVIEYDRILVMDNGHVAEFASPLDLLRDEESMFYKMCVASGEFEALLALAKSKHQLVDV